MFRLTRENSSPLVFISIAFLILSAESAFALDTERLSPNDIHLVKMTLKLLKPFIDQKKSTGAMNLLTFEQLYAPLSARQKNILEEIRKQDPKQLGATAHTFGPSRQEGHFVKVPDQSIQKNGSPRRLPKQYLPQEVYEAYRKMMEAMQKNLGTVLYVDSGYRSPAYQLYLFLYYLPKHGYSIREANRFVALPGHSEHGAPEHQAIDFINEEGVNGEDNPEAFETLPEYRWLTQHAKTYGFFLSYPRDNRWGTSFEPWHWHYEAESVKRKTQN